METTFNDFKIKEKVLFSSNIPTDIVICGDIFNDKEDFTITDDYYDFHVTINGKRILKYGSESNGFVSIVDLKTFMEDPESNIDGFDENNFNYMGVDFILVHNFIGDAKLRVNVDGIGYIDTADIDSTDLIMYDTEASDNGFSVEVDIKHGEVFNLDKDLYHIIKKKPEYLKSIFDKARKLNKR
jgi:hypothetical protein